MTSCILTVIKNEHQYLDEWIIYHLGIGINHIFIFEDIDSDSHSEITNKYGDRVSLNSVNFILNDGEKKYALSLKKQRRINVQDLYFKNGIWYIKQNYQYDWCFVIDVDEFITLTNGGLKDTLSLFEKYDAFVMSWECHGADGRIEKPDYSKGGVIDYYPNKCKGFVNNNAVFHTKTCYNLNTFSQSFYKTNHQPSNKCHWCRTDYSINRIKEVYDLIYIRHYITKSWEEYIDKKHNRGFFVGISRTYDFFFNVNPDMDSLKNGLIGELKKEEPENEALIVLPYKQSRAQGKELYFTLHGWEKFCLFKYHFVVIGEFDDGLKREFPWVEFIYLDSKPKKEGQYNPHLDIMNKFEYVRQKYSNKYNGFVYMTDDEYPIKPFTLDELMKVYYLSLDFQGRAHDPTWYWTHDKWKTRQLLDKDGLPHVNYTTHFPYFMEFEKLKIIMDKYNLLEESYVFDDIYFNYFSHQEPIQVDSIRLGIWSKNIFENKFKNAVNNPNIKFICNSVEGWSVELEKELEKLIK